MTNLAVVTAGRRRAESLMTLTLTAYAPGKTVVDGYEVEGYTAQGTCVGKVQGTSSTGRDTVSRTIMVGQIARPIIEGGLQIPLDAFVSAGVLAVVSSEQRGIAWEFVVTAVGGLDDPALVGRRLMVTNCPVKSFATARRCDVVEVPAP